MQTQRELTTFPIAPIHKTRLYSAGFLTVEDIQNIGADDLSKEAGISVEDAKSVLDVVVYSDDKAGPEARSALDLLQEEQGQPCIVTFSQDIDKMLGGGVSLGKLTEFCGVPGIGKTQMCLQLSVDVQIPEVFGGLEGEAVYIDTEGSFLVERFTEIAMATVAHCQHIASLQDDDSLVSSLSWFNIDNILKGVHYIRCRDHLELLATVQSLEEFLHEHPKVKLVIVDSIAFHFRLDFDDMSLRTRLLTSMAQTFLKMAASFNLAMVVTNQMTTKVRQGASGTSHLVPALGDSWGHAVTVRVIMQWDANERRAWLYKSPAHKQMTVPYQITSSGIRDIVKSQQSNTSLENEENPPKRQKIS